MNEFEAIRRYLADCGADREEVVLGVGDDAALLGCGDWEMAVCTDTLVEGVHFPVGEGAGAIGHKALAVNLSDLAAMGAEPVWAMVNLTAPSLDERWLAEFVDGFSALAREFGVALIGGDTTRGPLVVSVQTGGRVAPGEALRRAGASPGDVLYVSGPIGDGRLGLDVATGCYRPSAEDADYLLARLRRPRPEVAAGRSLRGVARAVIDVSDGLLADLGHLLEAGCGLGASLRLTEELFSAPARRWLERIDDPLALVTGGDDYRLCFAVAEADAARLSAATRGVFQPIPIGRVEAEPGLRLDWHGSALAAGACGYDHFREIADG